MSGCACCSATEREFDRKIAEGDLRRFLARGPEQTTRKMLAALREALHAGGVTLLDIGGGIGAIHHTLLDEGFAHADHVDASSSYISVAEAESRRRAHGGRVTFHHGDFHALAHELPMADVVTLDRVVCCDPDGIALLGAAADHARRLLSFSFPQDRWYTRAVVAMANAWRGLWRRPFRAYVHDPAAMFSVLEGRGLRRRWNGGNWIWRFELFERTEVSAA